MEKGLCEICNPKQWRTISSDMLTENGYPVYGANGIIGYYEKYNHKEPTILITCRGATCGTLNICEPFSYVNGNAMALDNLSEELNIQYLYYYLLARGLSDVITGSAQPQIVRQSLEKVKVKYPPIDEQRKIAMVLDKVSDLIAKRRQQLSKLDELVKARFVEMFGDPLSNSMQWECEPIFQMCKAIYGGGTPPKSHPEYFRGNIPWVTPKDMKSTILVDSLDHITEEAVQKSSTKIVPIGAVLMVVRSGILKHSLPLSIAAVELTINQDMKAFIPGESITSRFLMYYLKMIEPDVLSGVRGVTADNIDFKEFRNRLMIAPPVELQRQYEVFVEQTDEIRAIISQNLNKLEWLKKALMQEYFG